MFLAVLGLCCCVWVSSGCGEQAARTLWVGSLWWPLVLQGTGSRECRLQRCYSRALGCALSSCVWAELPHGMWGLYGPGIKPIACVGRWIPNHWTTREVENFFSGKFTFDLCIRRGTSILCCVCSSHFSINLSDSQ